MTLQYLEKLGGCSCHIAPPCSFCESLDEQEAEVFHAGGVDALRRHIEVRDFGLISASVVHFDTETSGLAVDYHDHTHPQTPNIVSLAVIVDDAQNNTLAEYYRIIKPEGFVIPPEATAVHGISHDQALAEGIPLYQAIWEMERLMVHASKLVAFNHKFDRLVLKGAYHRLGLTPRIRHMEPVCTMLKSVNLAKVPNTNGRRGYKWPKLEEAYRAFFGEEFNAHHALDDTKASRRVYGHLQANGIL